MKIFQTVYEWLFGVSAALIGCYAIYMYWRLYQLYKLAGGRVESIGFQWFAIYVQAPHSTAGTRMVAELPQDIQSQIAKFRLEICRVHIGGILWVALLILFASTARKVFT